VLSPANAPPLQQTGAVQSTITIKQTPANAAVVFQPNGTAPALAVGANGRFMLTLCDSRGANFAREVEVSVSGIIQASATPGKDVSGAALVCP
jgi:phosphoserine aminotransferase